MIYTDKDLANLIRDMIEKFENEVVEFKEAQTNYSFKDIGKYFSALSNEANIRGEKEAWLIFGVDNQKNIVGTSFRKDGSLQNLKKEIISGTNEYMSFIDIYDLNIDGKRVVAFQIPPATRGIPTTWHGAAYAREYEHLCPLSMDKMDLIRSQIGVDWSKKIVEGASLDDLDPEAVATARKLFLNKEKSVNKSSEILEKLSDSELLNKAGILIKGQITNAALILLGKKESAYFFDGFIPRITWTLYSGNEEVRAYEHFDMPLLMAVDKVYGKIRNEKYRYIANQRTLFPEETFQYDQGVIREILNNCIAHSNYQLRGKINVLEYDDRLVFINEGHFIPETVEKALSNGYKPPYYRNSFLCQAMVNLFMIDTNSMRIPMIYQIQRKKYFPLPTYDLNEPNRVKVTLYGRILDENYSQLLFADNDLDLSTIFLLDKVQKQEIIHQSDYKNLKKKGLIEGRYPKIFVSYKVASMVGLQNDYIVNKGLSENTHREIVIDALSSMSKASIKELKSVLDSTLPGFLDEKKKSKRVSNIMQSMKKDGIVAVEGYGGSAKWFLTKKIAKR